MGVVLGEEKRREFRRREDIAPVVVDVGSRHRSVRLPGLLAMRHPEGTTGGFEGVTTVRQGKGQPTEIDEVPLKDERRIRGARPRAFGDLIDWTRALGACERPTAS